MKRTAKLDSKTAQRWQRFGALGEQLALEILLRNGFTNIRNVNTEKMNFAYADVVAERDGKRYVISVKARNKYERVRDPSRPRRLNSRYKLGARCYELAATAEKELSGHAAWLAIAVERATYSAYFGLLASLNNSRGIAMSERATMSHECLAQDEPHPFDYDALENVYEDIPPDAVGAQSSSRLAASV